MGNPDLHTRLLGARFQETADAHPERIAVEDRECSLTYRQLMLAAEAVARRLRDQGVRPGDLVGVALPRSVDLVVAVVGINRAGAAYVPVDLAHPPARRSWILDDAGVRVIVADASLGSHDEHVSLVTVSSTPARTPGTPTVPPAESPAYVIYTSGSTGRPKGVVVTQHNVARLFTATEAQFGFHEGDVWCLFHSIAFDFSVWELWGALLHGGRLLIPSLDTTRAPDAFHRLVVEHGVTVLNQTPTALRSFFAAHERAGSPGTSLRLVVLGGEALVPALLRPWFERHGDEAPQVVNMYGITETTVHATYRRMRSADCTDDAPSVLGTPLADLEIDLRDARDRPVPNGEPGEIVVSGPGVAAGYLNRDALTRDRFGTTGTDGVRHYRSGDLARRLPGGELAFVGRADRQVKIRGFRVELGEIESALRDAPDVRDARVLLTEQGRLHAWVVSDSEAAPNPDELHDALSLRLPQYMVPAAFVPVSDFPRTVNDKFDRSALPRPEMEHRPRAASPDVESSEDERAVASIAEEVLGLSGLAAGDDILRLGGTSLDVVRISVLCSERLGAHVSPATIFRDATVAGIARAASRGGAAPEIPVRARSEGTPLSPQQRALWVELKLHPDEVAYNEPLAFHVDGVLDEERFRRALVRMAERHEALRARIVEEDALPRIVADRQTTDIDYAASDCTDESAFRAALETPLDLAQGPLWRARLIHDGAGRSTVLLVLSHLILDGHSAEVLVQDMARAYDAPDQPLPRSSHDLLDVCAHDSRLLAAERETLETFWAGRLGTAETLSPALPPPLHPAAVDEGPRARTMRAELPPELVAAVDALAGATGTTPFVVYLTAYVLLLRTYAGADDITVGAPVSLRDRPETQDVVGYQVSPVAFRHVVDPTHTCRDALRTIDRSWRRVQAHARLPLDLVLRAGSVGRATLAQPEVYFAYWGRGRSLRSIGGHAAQEKYLSPPDAKFKLSFTLVERDDAVSAKIETRRDVFDEAMATRFIEHYRCLLHHLTENPGQAVEALSALGHEEKARIQTWESGDASAYPRDLSVLARFREIAEAHPRRHAIVCGNARVSYADLRVRAEACAATLAAAGVTPGDHVLLVCGRGVHGIVWSLATLDLGAVYVPIDPEWPAARVELIAERTRARVGVAPASHEQGAGVSWLDIAGSQEPPERAREARDIDPDAPAYVMFTSGSSGHPKGVVVSHRAILNLVIGQDYARFDAEAVWLHMARTWFDASTVEIWGPLLHGGTCLILEDDLGSARRIAEVAAGGGATTAFVSSALFNAIMEEAPASLGFLRELLTGGEAVSMRHVGIALRTLSETQVTHVYGPTENTTFSTYHPITKADLAKPTIPIGRPLANSMVYVLDRGGQRVPIGVPGELVTCGDGVALGYLGGVDPASRFVVDPLSRESGMRVYRTGDRARWRPDGNLEFLGRYDDQVKLRGHRVEPGEVAVCLERSSAVRRAVVLLADERTDRARLVAFVMPHEDTDPATLDVELMAHMRSSLPGYLVPAEIVAISDFPRTASGKVDRNALLDRVPRRRPAAPASPSDAREERVLSIWRRVLDAPAAGMTDDFFEAGGHSVLAVRLVAALERQFQTRYDFRSFFRDPTPRGIAEQISDEPARGDRPEVVRLREGSEAGTLFCIPGVGGHVFSFRSIAQRLAYDGSIVGLQLQELDRYDGALEDMNSIADALLEAIRDTAPVGPILLLGYSFGGNLAVEIARRLDRAGEAPVFLGLIDAYAPGRLSPASLGTKLRLHLREMIRSGPIGMFAYIGSRVARRLGFSPADPDSATGAETEARIRRVSTLCEQAFFGHRPAAIHTHLDVFRATRLSDWVRDDEALRSCGWGELAAGGLHVVDIECEHLQVFDEPHVSDLIEAIEEQIQKRVS